MVTSTFFAHYISSLNFFSIFGQTRSLLDKYKVIFWLLFGECGDGFAGDDSGRSLQVSKYRKTVKKMKKRAKDLSNVAPGNLNVVTGKELMNLIVNNGSNDVILGYRLFLKDGSRFYGHSFDHVVPVATIKADRNAFSINNIQLMSQCLNDVKGCYNNYELIFWLNNLLANCIERYSSY
jgi:hypothetical protein